MHNIMQMTLAAALLATGITAQAQTNCKNRVLVDAVYQVASRSGATGQYEYMVQLRNVTNAPVSANLNFSNFPSDVSLFSVVLPNVTFKPYGPQTVKFGRGANAQINTGTVKVQYDTTTVTGKPTVSVTGCK